MGKDWLTNYGEIEPPPKKRRRRGWFGVVLLVVAFLVSYTLIAIFIK